MKKLLLFVFFCLGLTGKGYNLMNSQSIIYVNDDASGNADGSSWTDAYSTLQEALNNASAGDQIWVAQGTYYPTTKAGNGTTDRDKAFVLVADIAIYGGFDGTETTLEARADATGENTILSGDIGTANDSTDNCYHIVIASDDVGTAELNGFTITGGNANGTTNITVNQNSINRAYGAGMNNQDTYSSPIITNVIFKNNTAMYGAGMNNNYSSPVLTNVTFLGNSAINIGTKTDSRGGGMYNTSSSAPILTNVTFSKNSAAYCGGGIYNYLSYPTLTNVTISGNSTTSTSGGGGGIYCTQSSELTLINVIISGNTSSYSGGGIYYYGCTATFTNVIITGNSSSRYGGGIYNGNSTNTLTNVTVSGNLATKGGGMYFSTASTSTNFYNSIIWGNTASSIADNVNINTGESYLSFYSCLIEGSDEGSDWGNGDSYGGGENNIDALDSPFVNWIDPSADGWSATTDGDYSLSNDSPCIDTGSNSYVSDITTDNIGNDRIYNSTVDIGAYEASDAPEITSQDVTDIGSTTATGNGTITNIGTSAITAYGVCWSTSESPTLSDSYSNAKSEEETTSTGAFTSALESLSTNTTYYVRAYATNASGTSYGSEVSFTTLFAVTFVDYDGLTLETQSVASGGSATTPSVDPTRTGYTFTGWEGDYSNITENITVTALYEAIDYTIEYNLDGGTNVNANPDLYTIETATITLNSPSKTGYDFAGWYSDAGFETSVSEITTGSNGDIALYAKWDAHPYTVTYNLDNGTNDTDNPNSYTIENATITFNNPTKTGYDFAGWYSDASFTTAVTEISTGSYEDITLYAKWIIQQFTVTFADYDGSAIYTESVNYGSSATAPSTPARTGYTFTSWEGDYSNISEDITVTAQYSINSYTVIFADYDGSEISSQSVNFDSDATAPSNPSRTGYTFTGWNDDYSNITEDITVTAQYSINSYTVTYNLDGGTNDVSNPDTYTVESDAITLNAPTKSGYNFAGWYSDENFTTQVTGINQRSTGNIELWAQWEVATSVSAITSNAINIYPNPTQGIVTINTGSADTQKVSVFDITGKKIYTKTNLLQNATIDLSNLNNGMYILRIEIADQIFTKRIIKK